MNRDEAIQTAKHLARAVFECGSEPNAVITRIQFMSGRWPDNEKERGGLCEQALVGVLADALLAAPGKPGTPDV